MKRLAIVFVLILFAIVSFGQTDNKSRVKKTTDPSKKETVKTVPKSAQKKTQIKKAQIKKAQIQNKKKKQIIRKSKAIRRKRNG